MARYYFEKQGSTVWIHVPDSSIRYIKQAQSVVDNKGALAKKLLNDNSDKALPLKGIPPESAMESPPLVATLGNKGL